MEDARKIIDLVFKTISKLSDEEIEELINKEAKLVYTQKSKSNNKNINSDSKILNICDKLNSIKSKEEAYKLLNDKSIKKDMLIDIAKHMDIHVLKSYNKAKIIDRLIESTVGLSIDRDSINNVDIN